MIVVYNPRLNLIGLLESRWELVATQRPVPVVSGKTIAYIYLQEVMPYNADEWLEIGYL